MRKTRPQKQLLQLVMLSLLSVCSVLVMANESFAALDCSGCHGTTAPTDYRPVDAAYRNITSGGFVGSHRKHMATTTTNANDCTVCHNNSGYSSSHRNGVINMSAGINYSKGVFFNQTSVPVLGTCATASCHIAATDLPKATPVWGATADCNSCHDATPATGAHTKHLSSLDHMPVCGDCHTGASATNGGANHLDNTISVAAGLGYPTSTAKHASTSYSGSCSTTYCHSSGQSATGLAGPPVYAAVAPTWGNPSSGACGTCHATTTMATGSHAAHLVKSTNCGNCHTGASASSYNATTHVDGNIDVAAGVGYTAGGAPGNGYSACSTASCHAIYTNVAPLPTPIWGQNSDCSSCHDGTPITGAHSKHYAVAAIGFTCGKCHTSSGASTHVDGSVNVIGTLGTLIAAPVAKHASNAYAATCTTACHAVYGATGSSPNWGVTGAGCATCHLTAIPATGLHTKHLAATGGTCTQCHAAGYTATTVDATDHANGTIQVTGQGYPANVIKHAVGAPNYATCATATCHDAYGTTGVSASWNTVTTSCASCHAASPATGSHVNHVAHINTTCVSCHTNPGATGHINGTIDVAVGSYPAGKGKGTPYNSCSNISCHNGPTFSAPALLWGSTPDCAGCHGYPPDPTGTHNGVIPGANGVCNSCHSNVLLTTNKTTPTATAFANVQLHMDGIVQGGKCDACHGYPPVPTMAGLVNYSGAKLQNYSGGGGVHAVAGHLSPFIRPAAGFGTVGSVAPGCVTCHPSNSHNQGFGLFSTHNVQVVVDPQFKFDKNRPIVYNAKQSGTSKTSGTCTNVACHFQKSPIWSSLPYTQGH